MLQAMGTVWGDRLFKIAQRIGYWAFAIYQQRLRSLFFLKTPTLSRFQEHPIKLNFLQRASACYDSLGTLQKLPRSLAQTKF